MLTGMIVDTILDNMVTFKTVKKFMRFLFLGLSIAGVCLFLAEPFFNYNGVLRFLLTIAVGSWFANSVSEFKNGDYHDGHMKGYKEGLDEGLKIIDEGTDSIAAVIMNKVRQMDPHVTIRRAEERKVAES